MSPLKRCVLWATLMAIVVLTGLSVYGAFLGANRAQEFFNSPPVVVYWFALTALLVIGINLFRRLWRVPALLLMHAGCVFILVGAMWGSEAGHAVQWRLFGIERIPKGVMPILEGTSEDRVMIADSNDYSTLPFSVRLRNFRIEYYNVGTLFIRDEADNNWRFIAEPGRRFRLGHGLGTVTVLRVFQNFRMDISGDEPVAFDAPGDANPAVQVQITRPDGTVTSRYVFEGSPGHMHPQDQLAMGYRRSVQHYISELDIIEDGVVVASKDIEVNHPLYYGGYHFYQQSYGANHLGQYTVLGVVSDAGLRTVFAGYAMLVAGLCWHFWGRRILTVVKRVRIVPSEASQSPQG